MAQKLAHRTATFTARTSALETAGYPGLCVRGTRREYCIGCPFVVRRPEYIDRVDFFLESYTTAAAVHERTGDLAGARERQRRIAELNVLRHEMLLLAEAERDGSWTPRWKRLPGGAEYKMNDIELPSDPFAHLKQHASQRANRTVERLKAAIAALCAANQKVTAEAIKLASRELEPGTAGVSFQVIRRNPGAYAFYREAADAFNTPETSESKPRGRQRRARRSSRRVPRSSYDPLQRLGKRDLVRRIRAVGQELEAERQRCGALACDQQALRAKILRLETEIILLQVGRSHSD